MFLNIFSSLFGNAEYSDLAKITIRHTPTIFLLFNTEGTAGKICQTVSDRPKIMEKFNQLADENGHVLLPVTWSTARARPTEVLNHIKRPCCHGKLH